MNEDFKVIPLSNRHIANFFARGLTENNKKKTKLFAGLTQKAIQACINKGMPWQETRGAIDSSLGKRNLGMRIAAAGMVPFVKYPVAVIFSKTGDFCQAFELVGLPNEAKQAPLPVESQMTHSAFISYIENLIKKKDHLKNMGLKYDVMMMLQKIPGLSNWGVTIHEDMDPNGWDLLVLSEVPFGMEFKHPIKPSADSPYKILLSLDEANEKKMEKSRDGFFLKKVMDEIARSWPTRMKASILLERVERILMLLEIKGFTMDKWEIDTRPRGKKKPISWAVDIEALEKGEFSGVINFNLVSRNRPLFFEIGFSGFSKEAAMDVEFFPDKNGKNSGESKTILKKLNPFRKKEQKESEAEEPQITAYKAPGDLTTLLAGTMQKNMDVSIGELKKAYQKALKKRGFNKSIRTGDITLEIHDHDIFLKIPDRDSGVYTFTIDRRKADTEAGLVQIDKDGKELQSKRIIPATASADFGLPDNVNDDESFLRTKL